MQKFLLISVLFASAVSAQKKVIDHHSYNDWKDVKAEKISDDGAYVSYEILPQVGDGWMYLYSLKSQTTDSVMRAKKAVFGPNSNYLIYELAPGYDTVRTLKLAKTKPSKMPKDTTVIRLLNKDTSYYFPKSVNYDVPEEGNWLTIKLSKSSYTYIPPKPKRRFLFFKKKNQKTETRSTKGKDLIMFNTETAFYDTIKNVVSYDLSDNGKYLAVIQHWKVDTLDSFVVQHFDLDNNTSKSIFQGFESASNVEISYNGSRIAFLAATDTAKKKIQNLYLYDGTDPKARMIVDTTTADMPDAWSPSKNMALYFSEDETKLYFGIAPHPYNPPKDTLLDTEKYKVDIWNWQDKKIQPQQLKRAIFDAKKTYTCVWHVGDKKFVQLEDLEVEGVFAAEDKTHDYVIGSATGDYEISYSWSMPWKRDYYLINEKTGEKKLMGKGIGSRFSLSPSGKYATRFSEQDSTWYVLDTETFKEWIISSEIREELAFDNNGSPYLPGAYGSAGWNTDESGFMIYAKRNIWLVDVRNPDRVSCMTCGLDSNIVFRHIRWDRDEKYIDLNEDIDLLTYNEKTKGSGISRRDKTGNVTNLIQGNFSFYGARRSKNKKQYIVRKMTFQDYPDMYLYDREFDASKRLTVANPQQSEYKWGSVELINWEAYDGEELEGLLYKPEDFDSTKSYPMITYFYERYDDQLHRHYVPKPTASIVYPTEYVSNGYLVFIPNVEYVSGHPGKSAFNCIVSGTDYLSQFEWVDTTKIGLQGQSWGGYQTAYLVTQTDKYAAAMAGAPVSNMISAYGGIRWGSGLSRMFQYEHTQSRIGYTIWDSLDLYIENSPLFFAPNVNTPLLMMHNDGDGAVPWYQGIEYFMALRRLNKPVWMLNYNGDAHNLRKRPNKVDLSIRMRQFFDHYLLGEAAPVWMTTGVPAVEKGRVSGYELDK